MGVFMENGKIDVVKKERIGRVTISNPKKLNALDIPMIMQLREIFWDLNSDQRTARNGQSLLVQKSTQIYWGIAGHSYR